MSNTLFYSLYLLVVWGVVRYFFRLPEVIEELWLKPVIWLTPIFVWNSLLKKRIGFWDKNHNFKSIVWGVVLGIFYWLLIGSYKLFDFSFSLQLVVIAFSTAVVEEMVFNGFVLAYLRRLGFTVNWSLIITSLLVVLERLPIMIFVYKVDISLGLTSAIFIFGYSMLNGFLRVYTKSLAGSIVARWFLNASLF